MSLDALLASLRPGGRDFERVCQWALENVPEYRQRLRKVWLWDDWPGRWGRDAGIDLVAEDHEGGLWAVQAKHYAPAYAIKKADLDSFLSESSRPGFTYRLVIASTDHLGLTARRTLDAQEKPVGTVLRSQLEALDVAWPTSVTRLQRAKPKRKRPRPHQRRVVVDCAAGLEASERGQLVMACGTGKTLVGPFLAERMAAKRVLVLLPSLSLLGQTIREWATATDFDYLAVCSDDTVTKDDHDAVVASTSELGVPVTTDAVRIARFLRRRGTATKVIFSTYQSSPQIAAAQTGGVPVFDLVIADEAHRCAGPQAGVFATVLDPARIKARKRLFMTATPRYFTGRVKTEAKEADWEVASMDEEEKFGPVMHRLTFGQAIEQDLLSDYRVVVVGVTDDEAHDLAIRGTFVTRDGKTITDARTLARQIGLLRSMAKYDLRRVVTFHSRIDHASRFASALPGTNEWLPPRRRLTGSLWTDLVSGKLTAGERDARLRRLKGVGSNERGVLTNARCLSEGVDVPTLDGVAFIDPRRSQIDVVQAVGRAIRRAEDKTVGTIVIPVLVAEEADPELALESSEFDRVWEVVRALRDHDEDLAGELDELRRGLARTGSAGRRPAKLVLDLPANVGVEFARAFDARLIERGTSRWQRGFGHAEGFWRDNGHLRVPVKYRTTDGFPLGAWLARQRPLKAQFSPQRVADLDAIGMVWDVPDQAWQDGLDAAARYRAAHGDLRVPHRYVAPDGYALGVWLNNQKQNVRLGKLPPDRVRQLDALGMVWDSATEEWRRHLAAAATYRVERGDVRVHDRYMTADGLKLGAWVTRQRRARRAGELSPEQIADLDALGMVWEPYDAGWERGMEAATAYAAEHGDLRVPADWVSPSGLVLGTWITRQRSNRRRGQLSPSQIAALDALGMTWEPLAQDWREGLAAARAYRLQHGDLRVPDGYVTEDGFRLAGWIAHRRNDRRVGRLNPERIAELDELGMSWEALDESWRRYVEAARSYRAEHGHIRVPGGFITPDGVRLGAWVNRQRLNRRRGLMSPERIAELDELGMVWGVNELRWQQQLEVARAYQAHEGHLRVRAGGSADQVALRAWLNQQRLRRRKGNLAPERIADLDALGIEWDPGPGRRATH